MATIAPVRAAVLVALSAAALVAAGCGSSAKTSSAPLVNGPGITETKAPWKPGYAHLRERMKRFAVPPPGTEKFHHHVQLHIYADGLLVPVPAGIGLGPGVAAGLHTHAPGGVIHIEATKPFSPTLGAFFAVWGVPFGAEQVGDLKNGDGKRVHVVANGKDIADPIHYVMHEGDNLVVAYGAAGSFPRKPNVTLLREEQSGKGGPCGAKKKGQKKKSCIAGGTNP
jgi:hypothetical protein